MKFDLKPVPKAKNLDLIGWSGGYVLVQFKGRPTRYVLWAQILPRPSCQDTREPYPDKIFTPSSKTGSSATRSETDDGVPENA